MAFWILENFQNANRAKIYRFRYFAEIFDLNMDFSKISVIALF